MQVYCEYTIWNIIHHSHMLQCGICLLGTLISEIDFFFHTVRDIDEWQLVVIMHFNCVLQT